jgi:hypothetical protein
MKIRPGLLVVLYGRRRESRMLEIGQGQGKVLDEEMRMYFQEESFVKNRDGGIERTVRLQNQ